MEGFITTFLTVVSKVAHNLFSAKMPDLLSTFITVDFHSFLKPVKVFRMKFYSDFHSVYFCNRSSINEYRKLLMKRKILAVFKLNLAKNIEYESLLLIS